MNKLGELSGVPGVIFEDETVTGLPEPREGVRYIVSAQCFEVTKRKDVVAPSGMVRNAQGGAVACKYFRHKG